jgi:hypothetical protein
MVICNHGSGEPHRIKKLRYTKMTNRELEQKIEKAYLNIKAIAGTNNDSEKFRDAIVRSLREALEADNGINEN